MNQKFTLEEAKNHVPEIILGVLVLCLVVAYGNTLWEMKNYWQQPEYSHGYLVPLFTLVLLYLRWKPIRPGDVDTGARWLGIGLLAGGLAIRVVASMLNFILVDALTLIPCLFGVFLLVAGKPAIRWAFPAIAFLIFMYPLPGPVSRAVLEPLQKVATVASTSTLQTLGVRAYRDENRINISPRNADGEDIMLGVVEQCSGLRMLTIFVALAVALTLISPRPWWERAIIIVSAVPIALIVNITRISVTGLLHLWVGKELADKVFHDFAGWVMMPMAIALLYLEMYVLSHLVIDEETAPSAAPIKFGGPAQTMPRVRT